jgi:ELWxxDGT repeat protein
VSDVVPGKKGGDPQSLRAGVHASAPLLFTADDGLSGRELWASNGTPAGTSRVLDLRSGVPGSDPAFLALTLVNGSYSYLMAADDGRFEDASRYFQEARSLDPGFGAAGTRFQAAQAAIAGAQVSAASIEGGLSGTEGQTVANATNGDVTPTTPSGTLTTASQNVNPPTVTPIANSDRTGGAAPTPPSNDASTNGTGLDQPAPRTGTVTITLRRP